MTEPERCGCCNRCWCEGHDAGLAAGRAEERERLLVEEQSANRRAKRLAQEIDQLREARTRERLQYEAQINHLLDPLAAAAAKSPPPVVLDGDAAETMRLRAEVERLRTELIRIRQERDHYREKALTPPAPVERKGESDG